MECITQQFKFVIKQILKVFIYLYIFLIIKVLYFKYVKQYLGCVCFPKYVMENDFSVFGCTIENAKENKR